MFQSWRLARTATFCSSSSSLSSNDSQHSDNSNDDPQKDCDRYGCKPFVGFRKHRKQYVAIPRLPQMPRRQEPLSFIVTKPIAPNENENINIDEVIGKVTEAWAQVKINSVNKRMLRIKFANQLDSLLTRKDLNTAQRQMAIDAKYEMSLGLNNASLENEPAQQTAQASRSRAAHNRRRTLRPPRRVQEMITSYLK